MLQNTDGRVVFLFIIHIEKSISCEGTMCRDVDIESFTKYYQEVMRISTLAYENANYVDIKNCGVSYVGDWVGVECNVMD